MEPRRNPLYLALITICIVGAAPFLFQGRPTTIVLGLPLWLWSSALFTAGLSATTVWGLLRLWRDDDHG